jgi:hypothetical protein
MMRFNSKFLCIAEKLPQMHSTGYRNLPVVIEWPKGSVRTGEDDKGKKWKRKMEADYGYIPDTVAAGDKEGLDVYIGPDPQSEKVYVVEQLKEDGDFDEYKVMMGFPDLDTAYDTYLKHYPDDWDDNRVGDVFEAPFDYVFDKVQENQEKNEGENPAPEGVEVKNANNTGVINSPSHDRSVPDELPLGDPISSGRFASVVGKTSGFAYLRALQFMKK